jgi:hypothetical protein
MATTREELIAQAKSGHDAVCNCDPRYLMLCSRMAAAILALARPTPAAERREE